MSSSSEIVDSGMYPGQNMARAAEKSSFSQTCSLLSQYLKERRTFGDLSLGLTCGMDANGVPATFRQAGTSATATTMDLFPQRSGFGSESSKEQLPQKADLSAKKSEPASAQMTIFYAGQVIVLNDFPAEKAKEIMLLASKSSTNNFASNLVQKPTESINLTPSASNFMPNFCNNLIQDNLQRPHLPMASGLPLSRRASLTRFLEKRKNRVNARAPYQTSNFTAAHSKPVESKSWLGLAADSPLQFRQQL